jgi:hypothetical protein
MNLSNTRSFSMMTRCRLAAAVALMIYGLTGCSSSQRPTNISDHVPTRFSDTKPDPLLHTLDVGEVSGGVSLLNTVGIKNETFAEVLRGTLQPNALLAAPGNARWRVDSMLDFESPATGFGDQTVKAKIRYVLRDVGTNEIALKKVVETSGTKEAGSAGAEIALFILAGAAPGSQRRGGAYDTAVANNLNGFLYELSTWDGGDK